MNMGQRAPLEKKYLDLDYLINMGSIDGPFYSILLVLLLAIDENCHAGTFISP